MPHVSSCAWHVRPRRSRSACDVVRRFAIGRAAKAKRTNEAVVVDLMTLDEGRAQYGLDELPNGMGQLTLTAYRAAIQLEAQALLLATDPSARRLPAPAGLHPRGVLSGVHAHVPWYPRFTRRSPPRPCRYGFVTATA